MAVGLNHAPGGRGTLMTLTKQQLFTTKKVRSFDTVQARRAWLDSLRKNPGGCGQATSPHCCCHIALAGVLPMHAVHVIPPDLLPAIQTLAPACML